MKLDYGDLSRNQENYDLLTFLCDSYQFLVPKVIIRNQKFLRNIDMNINNLEKKFSMKINYYKLNEKA